MCCSHIYLLKSLMKFQILQFLVFLVFMVFMVFMVFVVQHYWGSFPFFPSCLRLRAEGGGGLSPKGSPRSSTKADNSCFCLSLSLGGGSFPSCLSFLSLLPKPELDRGLMEGGASFPSGLFFPSCLSLSLRGALPPSALCQAQAQAEAAVVCIG